jgi:hypothetical protein
MDYRDLLAKYMQHIVDCEGFDYVSNIVVEPGGRFNSHQEIDELKKIAAEIKPEPQPGD